jgi:protein O-GlcNAc transferase
MKRRPAPGAFAGALRHLETLVQHKDRRALQACQRLLRQAPRLAAAWAIKAHLDPQQAEFAWQRACQAAPQTAWYWYQLGLWYEQQTEYSKALKAYQRCMGLYPRFYAIYERLGTLLGHMGKQEMAITCYMQAILRSPRSSHLYLALADALREQGDIPLATETLMALMRAIPEMQALFSFYLGYLLERSGDAESARYCYEQALARENRAEWRLKRDLVYPLIPPNTATLQGLNDQLRSALRRYQRHLQQYPPTTLENQKLSLFFVQLATTNFSHLPYLDLPVRALREQYGKILERLLQPAPALMPPRTVNEPLHLLTYITSSSEKLARVYVSPILKRLDPHRFRVTIASESGRIRALFDGDPISVLDAEQVHWKVVPENPHAAIDALRAEEPDALYLTEPGWDSQQALLGCARIAPLQFTSWMTPGSTGLPHLDAFISSRWLEPPDGASHYSEQLVAWEHLPVWMEPPRLSEPLMQRSDFGLPDAHWYVCAQNPLKFHPAFDAILAAILTQDPLGQLLMVCPAALTPLRDLLLARFRRTMPELMARIWVLPPLTPEQFNHLLALGDVILDPLAYGGGTTAYQALGLGKPVVTLPGKFMVGRITQACYQQMGIAGPVANSAAEYVRLAVALGTDPAYNQQICQQILAHHGQIFRDQRVITSFANFLQQGRQG